MPAGLDGHPDRVVTAARTAVLDRVADAVIAARRAEGMSVVGIDGIDGAGKSTFADELALVLERRDVPVVRASIDSFHRPRVERWSRGRASPDGFYLDSHQLARVRSELLDPVRRGEPFVTEVFDEPSDRAVVSDPVEPIAGGVVLFDGIFLHRPELVDAWDLSIWLSGEQRVERRRIDLAANACPADPLARLIHLTIWWARFQRYVLGQRRYQSEVDPATLATIVIDNEDLGAPRIVRVPGRARVAASDEGEVTEVEGHADLARERFET